MEEPRKKRPVNSCIYMYKSKIKSDGSPEKLKLIIGVRRELQNKEMIGDTWSPTS